MHAVRTVQKTGPALSGVWRVHCLSRPVVKRAFQSAAQPAASAGPSAKPPGDIPMTLAQSATHGAQQRDENRWVYHPAIDGCVPQPSGDPDLLH